MPPASITFRSTRDALDADRQYALWLRATEGLPFAWSSSLANARHYAADAARFPGSRIYAENGAGDLVGYIGTMMPFEWEGIGTVAPTGFPWTLPHDPALEQELYRRMMEAIPGGYAAQRPRVLIQRFRASWSRQLDFVKARRWKERFREPILARGLADAPATGTIAPVTKDLLASVAALAAGDPCLAEPPTALALEQRLAKGWLSWETFWVCDDGAVALQVRPPRAEVKFFACLPGREEGLLAWLSRAARAHGATGAYFTLNLKRGREIDRARSLGFKEKDADVYMGLELEKA
jgi:hypothetical protein